MYCYNLYLFYLCGQFWQENNRMTFNFMHRDILKSQLGLLYCSRDFRQMIDDDYGAHFGRNMYTNRTSLFCYLLFLFFFQLCGTSFKLSIYIHSVSTMLPLRFSFLFQFLIILYILDTAKLEKGMVKG
jgi:hypothetical protein